MARKKSDKSAKTKDTSSIEDAVEVVADEFDAEGDAKRLTTEDLSALPDDTEPEEAEVTADQASEADAPSEADEVSAETDETTAEAISSDAEDGIESVEASADEAVEAVAPEEVAADGADPTETEEQPEAEPEPVEAMAPPPPPPAAPKRSAFPMLLAGAVVAALGFFAGRSDLINGFLPASLQTVDETVPLKAEIAQLREIVEGRAGLPDDIAAVDGKVSALTEEVQGIEFPEPDLTPVTSELGDLGQRIANIEALIEAASETPDYAAAFAGLQQASQDQQNMISDMLAEVEAEKAALQAEVEQAKADAEQAANATIAQAALAELQAAVDAGKPFAEPLEAFSATGVVDVPEVLTSVAADGVATLGALQGGISDAARNGLEAARADAGAAGGIAGFFEKQLGVRSLEPREGDDPDAVLSRVEGQVRAGDLAAALKEAELLPEPALAAMSDWLGGAKTRVSALSALQTLKQSLPTN